MYSTVVVGMQWGDEGKGKVIDCIAGEQNLVVRYQGGSNAGHTVEHEDYKFILHAVPTGVFNPHLINIIGNGSVIDLGSLVGELADLENAGIDTSKVYVSSRAHVTFPYHKKLEAHGNDELGTTKKGIGPTYTAKMQRTGVRISDLEYTDYVIRQLEKAGNLLPFEIDPESEAKESVESYRMIKDRIVELPYFILEMSNGNPDFRVLFEGAQGTMLDVDHGTYPFVTSSNATAGGAATGSGIPPKFNRIVGVMKAYTTRVGSGPLPTELGIEGRERKEFTGEEFNILDKQVRQGKVSAEYVGHYIRIAGNERGATTGRPRRVGWYDGVVARHAAAINGIDEIVLTKLDVLDWLPKIGVCNEYAFRGERKRTIPSSITELEHCKPVIEYVEGWQESISHAHDESDLPCNAAVYVDKLEEELDIPINAVSIGPKDTQIIKRRSKFP